MSGKNSRRKLNYGSPDGFERITLLLHYTLLLVMSVPVQPVAALDNAGILSQSATTDLGTDKITIVS